MLDIQVLEAHYIKLDGVGQPLDILPNTNLPMNLPLVQHQPPQNFSVKDQHLLKPPPVLGASEFLCLNIHNTFNLDVINRAFLLNFLKIKH